MNILVVSPEAVPYVKTGGLADVSGALFSGLRKAGHNAFLFLPLYKGIQEQFPLKRETHGLKVRLGERAYYFSVFSHGNVLFIGNDYFFSRDGIYGDSRGDFPDNAERFAFFCSAVLLASGHLGIETDIFQLNDWQTALLPFYLKGSGGPAGRARSVLAIHNLAYQGIFTPDILRKIGIPDDYFSINGFEFFGKVNLLKGGIVFSDSVTTVSPHYAEEIMSPLYGFGLEGLLKRKGITGILNGIDYSIWNPGRDTLIKARYDSDDPEGKSECKKDICKLLGLKDSSRPLAAGIGRLVQQKGCDIIADSIREMVTLGVNVAILGTGEREIEKTLHNAAAGFPDRVGVVTRFSEEMARKIYAGSDIFLMPSRFEPCGLAQMISMRYGSIPIARITGGLADSVRDFNYADPDGTGFLFREPNSSSFIQCLKRALCTFRNNADWELVRRNAMQVRFSWKDSVKKYLELYSELTKDKSSVHPQ